VSKSKTVLFTLLTVMAAAAIAWGVAGCANKTTGQQTGSAPSVTTNNGQPAAKTGSQSSAQTNQPNSRNFNPQQMQASMQKALAGLVSKGTITQSQADKVVQAYANFKPTPGSGQRTNPLDQLVTNGTLTQDQLTAIRQALPHRAPRSGNTGSGQPSAQ